MRWVPILVASNNTRLYGAILVFGPQIGILYHLLLFYMGHAVVQFVEALRYMPEGQGFDSQCVNEIFY
jgi:hypothetical protein